MNPQVQLRAYLTVAAAALHYAHSHTTTATEKGASPTLLEAAIGDAETALAYLTHAVVLLRRAGRTTPNAEDHNGVTRTN